MPTELPPATREEFYGEAVHLPETPEERRQQRERFEAMRRDPRFERFWAVLDSILPSVADETPPNVAG